MPLATAVDGALIPGQTITWTQIDGSVQDLRDATISGLLVDLRNGNTRAIAGTLVVADGENGIYTWSYDLTDVVVGVYEVQFTATYPTGVSPAKTFVDSWRVTKSL